VKSEKMGDKTLGGGEKKFSVCLEDEKRKTIGVKNKNKNKKTESRMLISQQHTSRVGVRLG
jgi:hypothetical protein